MKGSQSVFVFWGNKHDKKILKKFCFRKKTRKKSSKMFHFVYNAELTSRFFLIFSSLFFPRNRQTSFFYFLTQPQLKKTRKSVCIGKKKDSYFGFEFTEQNKNERKAIF